MKNEEEESVHRADRTEDSLPVRLSSPQPGSVASAGMARGCTGAPCARFPERHRPALSFALLVAGYVLYLLLGAGIFSAIELPYERELRRELEAARRDFLSDNTCVSDARLEELLARALQASNYGVSVLGNDTGRNWDFVSSLFFTSTVLTTTGEGTWEASGRSPFICLRFLMS